LGKEEAGELLTALVGDGGQAGLQPLKQLILEKTEGNPFFMEELVQALAEEGVLAGERGSYRLEKAATELHIPTTVQGVLAARIDRLPPDSSLCRTPYPTAWLDAMVARALSGEVPIRSGVKVVFLTTVLRRTVFGTMTTTPSS
jgi:hypothetical protein